MATAVAKAEAEHGAVGALVNSAGYAMSGCIEEASMAEVREQFEANVYGLVRLSQLVLPGMRAHGGCTIVNVSSISGRYAVPGSGFYNATKHAVEALSDALRNRCATRWPTSACGSSWSSQDRCAPPASAPPTWPICGR